MAQFLAGHPAVERVRYPGLPDSPYQQLRAEVPAARRRRGLLRSTSRAGARPGQRFIESLQLCRHLANVGDAKSLVIHPASTTHRQLSDEELTAAGIGAGTIRLSVGLEDARRPDLGPGSRPGARRHQRQRQRSCRGRRYWRDRDDSRSMRCRIVGSPTCQYQDAHTIREILHTARTIAIVGLSSNVLRPSNFVGFYLQRHGYRVVPVNPRETEVSASRAMPRCPTCLARRRGRRLSHAGRGPGIAEEAVRSARRRSGCSTA